MSGCKLNGSAIVYVDSEEEEVAGVVVGFDETDNNKAINMPDDEQPAIVNFEDEDGQDEQGALSNSIRALQNYQFNFNDLEFYFSQVEIKMMSNGCKKNYTKFQVLSSIIPSVVQDEVKKILRKKETDLNGAGYKRLKDEIIRIFGPSQEADFERAMSRTLTGKPSQLARALVNDLCDDELEGCHCSRFVVGLWKRQLPVAVRQGIAHLKFNHANFDQICQMADDIFSTTRPSGIAVAALSQPAKEPYITPSDPSEMDKAFHEAFMASPEVAALRSQWRGGRRGWRGSSSGGRGRGGRGGRGSSASAGGGSAASSKDANVRWPNAKRSTDLPPVQSCKKHWIHGKKAHWCEEPGTCPWKNYFTPRTDQ